MPATRTHRINLTVRYDLDNVAALEALQETYQLRRRTKAAPSLSDLVNAILAATLKTESLQEYQRCMICDLGQDDLNRLSRMLHTIPSRAEGICSYCAQQYFPPQEPFEGCVFCRTPATSHKKIIYANRKPALGICQDCLAIANTL